MVSTLTRRDLRLVNDQTRPYHQDAYDHVLCVTEWTESLRELETNTFETALTVLSNRLNVTTKQVTGWAAIIAVPTAITGWFSQNVQLPGKDRVGGVIASTVLILGVSGGLCLVPKHSHWT